MTKQKRSKVSQCDQGRGRVRGRRRTVEEELDVLRAEVLASGIGGVEGSVDPGGVLKDDGRVGHLRKEQVSTKVAQVSTFKSKGEDDANVWRQDKQRKAQLTPSNWNDGHRVAFMTQ